MNDERRSVVVPVSRPQRRRTPSLERLRRRTTSGRYIPEIDGLRLICIMLVVLLHIQEMTQVWLGRAVVEAPFGFWRSVDGAARGPVAWVVARGDLGVYVFFMISGFVLALPFAQSHRDQRETPSLAMYFVRRLTRIEPPYLVALLVSFALAPLAARVGLRQLLPHFGAGAVYSHVLLFGRVNPLSGPSWSLEIEAQFYVLVPLFALVFATSDAPRRLARIGIIGLAGSVAQGILAVLGFPMPTVLSYLSFFMAGFVLADWYVFRWHGQPATSGRWDLVWLFGWPLLFGVWRLGRVDTVVAPLLVALLGIAALRGRRTRAILRNTWLATIGGMCYSIYLTHFPLLILLAPLGRALSRTSFLPPMLVETLVLTPLILLVGLAFFVLVERPCMDPDWPRRLLRQLRLRRRGDTSSAVVAPEID